MEELQLALTPSRVDQRNFGLWINNWQIGQTLNALVSNQLPTGELVLRVAGQQITATADIPVQQGSRLLLEVKQLEPVPILRVLNPAPGAAPGGAGNVQLVSLSANALAGPPLAQTMVSAQNAASALSALPALAESLTQLLRLAPRAEQLLQPQALAQALGSSGVVMEGSVRAAAEGRAPFPDRDIKASLFRALAQLDGALAQAEALRMPAATAEMLIELRRELEAGVGRITLHQLASHPGDEHSPKTQHFEIPVVLGAGTHSLTIVITAADDQGTQQDAADRDEDNAWKMLLRFSPPKLGPLTVSMRLAGEIVDLRFAAARADVRALIDAGMPTLGRTLESRGLKLHTTAAATLANTPEPGAPSATSNPQNLDVRA